MSALNRSGVRSSVGLPPGLTCAVFQWRCLRVCSSSASQRISLSFFTERTVVGMRTW
jgi:hypothetical protein